MVKMLVEKEIATEFGFQKTDSTCEIFKAASSPEYWIKFVAAPI